jgi:hypothetical protein
MLIPLTAYLHLLATIKTNHARSLTDRNWAIAIGPISSGLTGSILPTVEDGVLRIRSWRPNRSTGPFLERFPFGEEALTWWTIGRNARRRWLRTRVNQRNQWRRPKHKQLTAEPARGAVKAIVAIKPLRKGKPSRRLPKKALVLLES